MSRPTARYDSENAPTHVLPEKLADKLVEAKKWHTERVELEDWIDRVGGIAERNQADRDDSDRAGALLLAEIVEVIDDTWRFGPAH